MLTARLPHAQIPTAYAWIAPMHDLFAGLVAARARRLSLAWADVRDGERVLEVAVGTGLSFQHLLRANPHGWTEGVDRTPAMLRRARRRAARVPTDRWRLRLGDAYALDQPDADFDVVLSGYLVDQLPAADFAHVLGGFHRVLRPGGRLILVNMTTAERPRERVWEGLYHLHPALLGGCRGIEATPYLIAAGFEAVRRARVVERAFPSEVVFGRKP